MIVEPDPRAAARRRTARASRRSPTGGRRRVTVMQPPPARAAPRGPPRGVAPHGTIMRVAVALDPALAQAALEQRRAVAGRRDHARAEVDARVRLAAVQRDVDLARALAADERPVGRRPAGRRRGSRPRAEVEPGAAAREQVVLGRMRGGELAQVDRRRSRARPAAGPRRSRAPPAPSPAASAARGGTTSTTRIAQRRRLDDEVHVLEAALDDVHARVAPARARGARHLARVAGVDRRVGDERDLVRPGEHAQRRAPATRIVVARPRARPGRARARRRARRR